MGRRKCHLIAQFFPLLEKVLEEFVEQIKFSKVSGEKLKELLKACFDRACKVFSTKVAFAT